MQTPQSSSPSRLMVLMFTDVVGSVQRKTRFGTPAFAADIGRHDELFRQAMSDSDPGAELLQDTGDGHFAAFPTASAAVRCALRFQHDLFRQTWPNEPLKVRIGIHMGEMVEVRPGDEGEAPKLAGLAVDLTARVMSLAIGGQILLTSFPFNDARQFIAEHPPVDGPRPAIKWLAHGPYLFKGIDQPSEVFEVGAEGIAPFSAPPNTEKAHRAVPHDLEETLGWRPAIGLEIPGRIGWFLVRKLGEGGFGEVWLGEHRKLHDHRVFKFCFDLERLRSFKREMTLFRLLRDALGDRQDIAKLHEVKLDEPPFFLESDYTDGGDLTDWAARQGGIGKVPLPVRLDLVARIADAVSAAHSVGILHKDIKPSNILIYEDETTGQPRPRLSDFGIGMLADRGQLAARNITETGFTLLTANESSRTGTRMYAPPELLIGKPFTAHGDVYALGVLLFQMVVGDLTRPIGPGSLRDVTDDLLRQDISDCIDVDPDRRIAGAGELAKLLRTADQRRADRKRLADAAVALQKRKRMAILAMMLLLLSIVATIVTLFSLHERRLALDSAARAIASQQLAESARAQAVAEQAKTAAALVDAQRQGYQAAVSTATTAVEQNQMELARQWLDHTAPAQRRWEWGYLRAQADESLNVLQGHDDLVNSAAFSPDGKWIVTASSDKTARVWDATTGRESAVLRGHEDAVTSANFSPDSTRVLTASNDQTARIWDAATGQPQAVLRGHTDRISAAAFSPDGTRVITGSWDKTARVWDAATGQQLAIMQGHKAEVVAAAFSPDGKRAVTAGSSDMTARVWDVDSGRELLALRGHADVVESAEFSPDGTRILTTGAGDKTARIWDSTDGREVLTLHHQAAVKSARFNRDGSRVVSACDDNTAVVWDAKTGQQIALLKGHDSPLTSVSFSPDGSRVATASDDQTARVWDANTGRQLAVLHGHSKSLTSVSFGPAGDRVVTSSLDGTARIWNATAPGELMVLQGHESKVNSIAFSFNGTRILTSSADGTARVWDPNSGAQLTVLQGKQYGFFSAAFSADATRVMAVSKYGGALVWNVATGELLAARGTMSFVKLASFSPNGKQLLMYSDEGFPQVFTTASETTVELKGHDASVSAAAFSPDGSRIITASQDRTARVWNPASGQQTLVLNGHTAQVTSAVFSPDGSRILTASDDQTARIWDAITGRQLFVLQAGDGPVNRAEFSPDGREVLTACGLQGRIWDANSGQLICTFRQPEAVMTSAAFSPDGTRLVTTEAFRHIARVWDTTTGREVATLSGDSVMTCSAFSPDGSRIAIGAGDGTARIWDSMSTAQRSVALRPLGSALMIQPFTPQAEASPERWPSVADLPPQSPPAPQPPGSRHTSHSPSADTTLRSPAPLLPA